ncbi:hypothetical protein HU200_003034 [Digitaria exilis]|uniref:Homeobox domain-containing protein n=1 Tax=Digitaria exilis TaxID=1010633 RepID=A0A835KUM8_9POAL|nr:hypothetical protein HU200_003034 [Digitaria exilis]
MAGDSACGVAQLGKRSSEWTATQRRHARALKLQPAQAPAVAPHVMRDTDTPVLRREKTPPEDCAPAAYEDETETESETETDEESDDGSDSEEDRPFSPAMAPGALTTTPAAAPRPPAPSLGAVPAASAAAAAAAAMAAMARKRAHRTRFSSEQKQRMQALSERLGWRLPRLDEAVVEETCREIGVTKAVFKVWMYNNRHKFIGGHISRRSRHPPFASRRRRPSSLPRRHHWLLPREAGDGDVDGERRLAAVLFSQDVVLMNESVSSL